MTRSPKTAADSSSAAAPTKTKSGASGGKQKHGRTDDKATAAKLAFSHAKSFVPSSLRPLNGAAADAAGGTVHDLALLDADDDAADADDDDDDDDDDDGDGGGGGGSGSGGGGGKGDSAISEETVLAALQARYARAQIYTRIGGR
jgi:hypothetical protein